jgi:hypothetical protein
VNHRAGRAIWAGSTAFSLERFVKAVSENPANLLTKKPKQCYSARKRFHGIAHTWGDVTVMLINLQIQPCLNRR